ncbi:hypothetical protein FACS189449_00260 [Alphaproteobacteria bacterium]|nr:hypothetical protein FACS189449_00260 [Alphaproteobacteria bacterium]
MKNLICSAYVAAMVLLTSFEVHSVGTFRYGDGSVVTVSNLSAALRELNNRIDALPGMSGSTDAELQDRNIHAFYNEKHYAISRWAEDIITVLMYIQRHVNPHDVPPKTFDLCMYAKNISLLMEIRNNDLGYCPDFVDTGWKLQELVRDDDDKICSLIEKLIKKSRELSEELRNQ